MRLKVSKLLESRFVRWLALVAALVLSTCALLLYGLLGYFVYSADSELMTKAEIRALAARCPEDRQVCTGYTDIRSLPKPVMDVFVAAMRPTPIEGCRFRSLLQFIAPESLMTTFAANMFIRHLEPEGRPLNWHLGVAIMQWKAERALSQETIASLFLNNTYFGQSRYGVEAASMGFFAKPPRELAVPEAAELAAINRAPGSHLKNKDRRLYWRNRILDQMLLDGTLTPERAMAFKKEPLAIE